MVVVHIAGSPGSGKTYLLALLRKWTAASKFGKYVVFKDTDDFVVPLFGSVAWRKTKTETERGKLYRAFVAAAVRRFVSLHKNKVIVLAGLTYYYAWDPIAGFEHGVGYSPSITSLTQGYFVDISDENLVKQRFHRDVVEVLKHKSAVLGGKKSIDFSAKMIKAYAKIERRHYVGVSGYTAATQRTIAAAVAKLIIAFAKQSQ